MVLRAFPDLQWLKGQSEKNFADRQGWNGRSLPAKGWPSVVLNVKAEDIYRDNILGPLSIFSNIAGESFVEADRRRVRIPEGYFYLTNHGQHYTLEVEKYRAEVFNIHFGEYFTEQVFSSLIKNPSSLLEESEFITPLERISFYNRLHVKGCAFNNIVREIKTISNNNLLLEEKLYSLIALLLKDDKQIKRTEAALPALKSSTKKEIIKRLILATDFIYTHYEKDFSLDDLAKISCLSKFHFLRLFKIAFRQTPHQFINCVRTAKAQELLKDSSLGVNVIARRVGFSDPSSFSRMFFNQVGVYPTQFR